MKRRHFLTAAAAAPFAAQLFAQSTEESSGTWKAGFARAKITPQKPFWMAGFGSRNRPAEGTLDDLWVKVLVLEDAQGNKGLILSSDLLGIPKGMYDKFCRSLSKKYGFGRDRLMLTASHTHSGPVLRDMLSDVYPLDDRQRALINEYTDWLHKTVMQTIGRAVLELAPVTLSAGRGQAGFALNRRTNIESKLPEMIRNGRKPKGPSDYDVPVLAVRSADGKLLATVFGYAAHTSSLYRDPYRYSGDYAGVTQKVLEEKYPGAQAMFFQGCGSDQSAAPRGTLERCRAMGTELAESVASVLEGEMRAIEPRLRTGFEFVSLDFQPPAREHLEKTAKLSSYKGRWARRLLAELDAGK
ncbi:MAG: neutral/alkaline non-lysosomal ceramidase N-terminal domain-containing protein, partial [Planctomycetota bacterium]|nr:neutral/alkaline non-lysosomal ceramidase N-terminal domain-containing protein [Planctomycetota bacterium]